jgi:polyhydroxyalkanoate synthase
LLESLAGATVEALEQVFLRSRNAFDFYLRPGALADTTPLEGELVHRRPQNTLWRYARGADAPRREPVLLVPPLAAPARCFDLRRGCSLVEHLTVRGHDVYVVDYGPIGFDDRQLGLEHWIEEVLPSAIRAAGRDAGGSLHLLGWSLGGIMTLLTVAARRRLPVRSVTMIGSPFDLHRIGLGMPVRIVAAVTRGAITTSLYRVLGTPPAPLTTMAFKVTSFQRYLFRPVAVAAHLNDREWLGHVRATDEYMDRMLAYPGRSFGQLFHRFFLVNDLADGHLVLDGRTIELSDVRVPVLAVAGEEDLLAPRAAVFAVAPLLSRAPEVRLAVAPGGHLGVLTGRAAPTTTWRSLDAFLDELAPRSASAGAV